MADSESRSSMASCRLLFDMDEDTPLPAAEALVGLKDSVRQRNSNSISQLSPRKRKTYNTRSNDNSLKSHDGKLPWASDPSDIEEDTNGPMDENDKNYYAHLKAPITPATKKPHVEPDALNQQPWIKHIKTFLRLPKALTWSRYEWFCSDIDKPFFEGSNDFIQCLDESFPDLKVSQNHELTQAQWRLVRRMIGKPRRCSSTFFAEERHLLEERRKQVRELQKKIHKGTHLSTVDFSSYLRELPDAIPPILTLGTRVTAWLNTETEKGFYIGTVEAVDLEKHQYWVTFDKPGVGKHSIADSDIKSMYPVESISISSLEAAHSSQHVLSSISSHSTSTNQPTVTSPEILSSDPLLASLPLSRRTDFQQQSVSLGGFPTDFLRQVVQMSKLLSLKQERLKRLSSMNTDAEKMHARHSSLPSDFLKNYATLVIDLDDINRQLNLRSEAIKRYTSELGYQDNPRPMSSVQECMDQAVTMTEHSNVKLTATGSEVTDENILKLIAKLSCILLQVEMLSQEGCSHDLSGLQATITEAASSINPGNQRIFMKYIEKPLALIQSGMDPAETLHPFSVSSLSKRPHRTTTTTTASSANMSFTASSGRT
ncbi:PREDICTED: protein lin-9 homolog [Amphimedon queenslandica]|uniref:DIRP domain-containing protein n=1 Tax=Amphimedon queenslandica TaxID=400682 RepID=A0A1X7VRY9_AMPQE|nr:PREDICTED: protein lin-9 homolog [Amphimedon queenslandica]|eukprot:XP_019857547.1 PREDICTED: protein lin-9 homolog [Amphimedon queenslandica]